MVDIAGVTKGSGRISQRPKAVAALVAAACITNLQDTLIKGISGSYPFHEMQSIRCGVGLVVIWLFAAVRGGPLLLPRRLVVPVVLRGLALATASVLYYLCAAGMPLPGAVALYFTMPLMVAVLAGPMLGERVPLERWLVVLAGLAGILVMLRPGSDMLSPAAGFGLAAAACYAFGNLRTRAIGPGVTSLQVAFWQNAMYLAIALVLAGVFGSGAFALGGSPSLGYLTRGWTVPQPADFGLFAAIGAGTALLMGLYTIAYRLAETSFVAPFEYSAMFWAVMFSWLLLGSWPDQSLLAGAALIMASGLFLMWREGRG